MTKESVLDILQSAKNAHENAMKKVEHAIEGKEVKVPTPVLKTGCKYGQWLYPNEELLIKILGAQLFSRIDDAHEAWHRDYAKIHNIFFKEEKKGLFSKLLGGDKKIESMELDKAKFYYAELQNNTKKVLHETDIAIRRVTALENSKFE